MGAINWGIGLAVLYLLALATMLSGCAQVPNIPADIAWEVDKSMGYKLDSEQYGKSDYWNANCPEYGDCEDIALCKLKKLVMAGYDKSKLGIMVAMDLDDQVPHATLVADGMVYDHLVTKYGSPKAINLDAYSKATIPFYICWADRTRGVYNGDYWKRDSKLHTIPKCVKAFNELGL